jgi:5-formyltetrahydrofolate cyclo-ligase
MMEKGALRKKLLDQRTQLSSLRRTFAEKKISEDLLKVLRFENGPLAFYWPVRGEYDPRVVATNWVTQVGNTKRLLCLPVVVEKNAPLVFKQWSVGDQLIKSNYNISAPHQESPETKPSVIIVPMLGYNSKNYRIGYGGGFYDRTLPRYKSLNIGVCFKEGKTDEFLEEKHDIQLDLIISA